MWMWRAVLPTDQMLEELLASTAMSSAAIVDCRVNVAATKEYAVS